MFINIHTHKEMMDAKVELVSLHSPSAKKPNLYSFGIHPWKIDKDVNDVLAEMDTISRNRRCIAIGECGLDKAIDTDFELQQKIFCEQIQIANEVQKPLMIHCVKAFNELTACLKKMNNTVPVIIHGFNNNQNIANDLLKHGYLLSFGKALMDDDSNASEVIKHVGRKNFFLENDDSDVSIRDIYKRASEILGIEEQFLQEQLKSNYQHIFKEEIL
ncbi:MAG: TatD family hydrolase [Sphingobacteriaceae bacterium]|nr:TatD family hydrolase [Sphingobacteriaceae bacterium]